MAEETQQKESKKGSFDINKLSDAQRNDFNFFSKRSQFLIKSRMVHYGHNLDQIWADADRDYVPHRLKTKKGKRVIATDEDKGWRGSVIELGADDWQSDISQSNPFVKIQTALSIMIDQNPGAVMTPMNKKYQATNEIIRQLYQRSWEYAKSKPQLKLFVYNLAKYGWACARTYPLRVTRKVKVVKKFDNEDPENTEYEEKEIIEYNDIMRENLDPRNVWIDDGARPNNPLSLNDWLFRKVYDFDKAKEEFGKYKRWEMVQAGGNTQETVSTDQGGVSQNPQKDDTSKNLVEVFFYENKMKDLSMVVANGVPIVMEPLPISDTKGVKRLSLWQTYWNLRHGESPYGIGIYEAIRYDQGMLDRIRNMTLDQLTLSIYKMFFYQGTGALTDTGDIKIKPGVGKQVLDPKNVNWLDIPGPGQDGYTGIQMMRQDVDEASGITAPLAGEITGKTAFEIAQAKESALKRLKNPLDNILEALNDEGYLTVSLMQLLYSIPETYEITDKRLIDDYMKEIQSDPELYEREPIAGEDGLPMFNANGTMQDKFSAKVYPEFPLNLNKDEKGNLIETEETQFFRIKPSCLPWEGIINIKSQSLLSPSKQVEKALETEMYNLLIPLMDSLERYRTVYMQLGKNAQIDNLPNGKVAQAIVKLYDKDPRDIFPDEWLSSVASEPPLFAAGAEGALPPGTNAEGTQAPQAETVVDSTQPPTNPQGLIGRAVSRITQPFRV